MVVCMYVPAGWSACIYSGNYQVQRWSEQGTLTLSPLPLSCPLHSPVLCLHNQMYFFKRQGMVSRVPRHFGVRSMGCSLGWGTAMPHTPCLHQMRFSAILS